ncbi:MAG: FHA domain-containing protein [Myxococcales bacterium]|nr:FHA domain-containing protein [Myxococcales bacterium]
MHDDSTKISPEALQVRHQGYRLQVLNGELRGREIEVQSDRIVIGKSRQCDVVLPDESVSRQHVEIKAEGDSYRVIDRGSTNGSFIGQARITDAFLKPGDVLGVGKVQLRFLPRDARAEILPSDKERFGEVLGRSLAMRKIFGVLERVPDPDDGRAKQVRFTAAGRESLLAGLAVLGELEQQLEQQLGTRRMRALHATLLALQEQLEGATADEPG